MSLPLPPQLISAIKSVASSEQEAIELAVLLLVCGVVAVAGVMLLAVLGLVLWIVF